MSHPEFFLHARWMMNGRMVEFSVNRGHQHDHKRLGVVSFEPDEWEAFRPLVVGGMRAAGFARIKVEMMDQTRHDVRKPWVPSVH